VLGLLVAGHATVSAGLTWSLYLLAARPAVQRRIRAGARDTELLAPFSDAHCAVALGDEDRDRRGEAFLDDLPYTRRGWQETIRLYPPLPVFGRTVREATTVGGEAVGPGMHVLLSPSVTHRDPAFWDAPDEFDPSRFEPDRAADRHEFAYLPFSEGRHACLGIATTEPVAVLASVCGTCRVEFARPHGIPETEFDPHEAPVVGVDSAINLQPDRDIHVQFRPVGRRNPGTRAVLLPRGSPTSEGSGFDVRLGLRCPDPPAGRRARVPTARRDPIINGVVLLSVFGHSVEPRSI
jgi:hypothetical protein